MAIELEQKYNRLSKKWEPKEWHPIYEEIVIKNAQGHSNKQLAHEYGCTPQHICNIVTTAQAKQIRKNLVENIRSQGMTQQERKMAIADKALERIESYFLDDEAYGKGKGAMADRAMKMLAGVGELRGENQSQNTNVTVIGDELGAKLLTALSRSDQVREKHGIRPGGNGSGKAEIVVREVELPEGKV